jgi:hypothetical protein
MSPLHKKFDVETIVERITSGDKDQAREVIQELLDDMEAIENEFNDLNGKFQYNIKYCILVSIFLPILVIYLPKIAAFIFTLGG